MIAYPRRAIQASVCTQGFVATYYHLKRAKHDKKKDVAQKPHVRTVRASQHEGDGPGDVGDNYKAIRGATIEDFTGALWANSHVVA